MRRIGKVRAERRLEFVLGPVLTTAGHGSSHLCAELRWGNANAGCLCFGVQAAIPDSDDKVRIADCEGTGEVDGVSPPERMRTGQMAGVLLDGYGELDLTRCLPVAVPGLLG